MPGSRRGRQRSRAGVGSAFLRLSVEQGEAYKKLSQELKKAGRGDLRKKVNRSIKDAGKPVVRDVQRAVRNVQVSSSQGGHAEPDKSTGLRDRIARATKLSVTQKGIKVRVDAKKVDDRVLRSGKMAGEVLPRYMDATGKYRRWRHPVFGNWDVPEPARQQQGQPYFGKTIKKHTRDFRSAIQKAMDDVADDIEE